MTRLVAVSALLLSVGCSAAESRVPAPVSKPNNEGVVAHLTDTEDESTEPSESDPADLPRWVWDGLLSRYRPDPYILDHLSRRAERDGGELDCPDLDIERYRGETIRYRRTVWVHPAFRERLKRFERVAARVGEEVYGRAPDRLFQRGTFVCKVIRHRRHRFSEHALGNAIDLIALGFPPLPREERAEHGELGRRFRISVEENWDGDEHREHAVFFRRLVQELNEEFVFRGMIVPPAAGHHDHLHLDMGPSRYLRGDLNMPAVEQ